MKKLFLVAGARPNFMKIAPIVRALARHRDHFHCKIVHTGQHYDREMSDVFFEELEIPTKPGRRPASWDGWAAERVAEVLRRNRPGDPEWIARPETASLVPMNG